MFSVLFKTCFFSSFKVFYYFCCFLIRTASASTHTLRNWRYHVPKGKQMYFLIPDPLSPLVPLGLPWYFRLFCWGGELFPKNFIDANSLSLPQQNSDVARNILLHNRHNGGKLHSAVAIANNRELLHNRHNRGRLRPAVAIANNRESGMRTQALEYVNRNHSSSGGSRSSTNKTSGSSRNLKKYK